MNRDFTYDKTELPIRGSYKEEQPPVLKNDEELVEWREPSGRKIHVHEGEIVLGVDGRRYPHRSKKTKSGFTSGGGRYIVKKKETHIGPRGKCDKCGESYVIGFLHEHYRDECKAKNTSKNQEVVMAEQKSLSYKRETLIDALKDAVTENERKREEDKRKKLEKDRRGVDHVIEMMKSNPRFAAQMLCQAAALTGSEIKTSEDVGTEAFKESVREMYPDLEDGLEPDKELKKLIRVYEKAEDETVEVHVHYTVYSYL